MHTKQAPRPQLEAHQTVRLHMDTHHGSSSIRISFCISHRFAGNSNRSSRSPHTSPNAYVQTDIALGDLGGILTGADQISRIAGLQSDPAVAPVLGMEAVPSQSTLSRFFAARLRSNVQALCRHDDAQWQRTEVDGIEVPEGAHGSGPDARRWWLEILIQLTAPPNCHAVGTLQA